MSQHNEGQRERTITTRSNNTCSLSPADSGDDTPGASTGSGSGSQSLPGTQVRLDGLELPAEAGAQLLRVLVVEADQGDAAPVRDVGHTPPRAARQVTLAPPQGLHHPRPHRPRARTADWPRDPGPYPHHTDTGLAWLQCCLGMVTTCCWFVQLMMLSLCCVGAGCLRCWLPACALLATCPGCLPGPGQQLPSLGGEGGRPRGWGRDIWLRHSTLQLGVLGEGAPMGSRCWNNNSGKTFISCNLDNSLTLILSLKLKWWNNWDQSFIIVPSVT